MATDRMRRRLRDVDSDDLADLTSNFCVIGTPLPSLNSHKKDPNELKPIWQQEARDAQGRRRFHGAFTGGFSAGYFNTVGSKEGWTPSTFRSSRSDKKAGKQVHTNAARRVEDFMDEEDLEDWKAAQQVSATSGFGQDDAIAGLRGKATNPLASALFGDAGVQRKEGTGWKLLRRMGWKEGQGLGPRVDAKKKARLLALVSNGGQVASSSDITLEDMKHLFAPPPTPVLKYEAKGGGRKGLGAEETQTLQQALARSRGAARKAVETAIAGTSSTEDEASPDGRPIPLGFRLATEPVPPEPSFPLNPVPDGWQPDPIRVWKRHAPDHAASGMRAAAMSPTTRGQLLGEAKIPGPPPSIAAFLSAKAQERLAASSNLPLPASPSQPRQTQYVDVPRLDVATAKQALQGFAPFGADPAKQGRYLTYLRFQLNPGSEEAKKLPVPPELTAEQFSNELREFAKSASMFRPMSSVIASRFTTASAAVMEHETKATSATPGLRHPAPASTARSKDDEKGKEPEKELNTAQKAAGMGNFGHLTRKTEPWAPERLICKRFGIPEPAISRKRRADERDDPQTNNTAERPDWDDPDPFYGSSKSTKSKSGIRVDQHWERNKDQLIALAAGPTPLSLEVQSAASPASKVDPAAEEGVVGMGDDERQGKDTLTYVKPFLDVYKAIFESDAEESDSDEAGYKELRKAKPKLQDPASGQGVLFQTRTKRKGVHNEIHKAASKFATKRKKEKASKGKSLLTFDLDDGDEDPPPASIGPLKPNPDQAKTKSRVRASDLF